MTMLSQVDSAVCGKYAIPPTALKGDNRERRVARPRQVAMYLARNVTGYSLPQIGLWYGNRDHTTVMHAVKRVEGLMRETPLFALEIEDLKASLTEKLAAPSALKIGARRFAAAHTGAEITHDLEQTG